MQKASEGNFVLYWNTCFESEYQFPHYFYFVDFRRIYKKNKGLCLRIWDLTQV